MGIASVTLAASCGFQRLFVGQSQSSQNSKFSIENLEFLTLPIRSDDVVSGLVWLDLDQIRSDRSGHASIEGRPIRRGCEEWVVPYPSFGWTMCDRQDLFI